MRSFSRRSLVSRLAVLCGLTGLSVLSVHAVPTSTATFTAASTPNLRLNEVLATNTRIANAGTFPDMIELHNAGATAVDLSGKSLTDDPAVPRKYIFPNGTSIPAGGYLTVYADTVTTTPGLHTGFALDAEGDIIRLHDSTSGNPLIDEIRFGFQVPDLSISRTGASADTWALTSPTLGAANSAALALGSVAGVKLNEWAGKVVFRLDHDMIELFNPAAQPVALGGVRLTDNVAQLGKFTIPVLSFVGASGFLPLYGADFVFGLDGDRETVTLSGENNEQIDQVTLQGQLADRSGGRNPDGSATIANFAVPTPGFANSTPLPAAYNDLLNNLRITEVMFDPVAESNASQFEFIELQNIGSTPLQLGGVRFTNSLDYEFAAGTTLAPGAFIVVVNDRSSFRSRYPQVPESQMAAGGFNGSLSNEGETLALTLPAPWRVHILRFRFEPTWYPSTSRGGYSLVPVAPVTAAPQDWQQRSAWRASAAVNGSPGVADPGTPSGGGSSAARLLNLSTRGLSQTGDNVLIPGFVISGTGTKRLLIRAVGPTLGSFGVPGTLVDPQLTLRRFNPTTGQYVDVVANDNWGTPAANAGTIASVTQSVGGFALADGSTDAAMVVDLAAGQYSAVASGANNGTGVALVELYDASGPSDARLANIATRGFVGVGGDVLISGFVVSPEGSKTVLIRAIGPALTAFGVSGALANPQLRVSGRATGATADSVFGENNDWSSSATAANTSAVAAQVGAFALTPGSLDAALVLTLPPGNYTAQASGVGETTGVALVEVYVVP